jgi:hypothetical protein
MWDMKKNHVTCTTKAQVATIAVILEHMSQQEAERRSGQGGDPVRKNAWAPVLADSGTRLRDVRVECEEDDPQRVWRLETLLENARETASEKQRLLETMGNTQYRMGVQIGKQENEIVSIYGHSYSRGDIEKWLKKKSKCPMTNQRLKKAHVPPNRALTDVADVFRSYQAGQIQ